MTTARIIDGKAFAANLRARVAAAVDRLKADHGLTPGLAVVLVGENPARSGPWAPAEGGKANAALIKLLAKAWRVPKGAISLVAGASSRTKTLEIEGDPTRLQPRLEASLNAIESGTAYGAQKK